MAAIGSIFAANLFEEVLLAGADIDILAAVGLETAVQTVGPSFSKKDTMTSQWTWNPNEDPDYSSYPQPDIKVGDEANVAPGTTIQGSTGTMTEEDELPLVPPDADPDTKDENFLLLIVLAAVFFYYTSRHS